MEVEIVVFTTQTDEGGFLRLVKTHDSLRGEICCFVLIYLLACSLGIKYNCRSILCLVSVRHVVYIGFIFQDGVATRKGISMLWK